MERYKIPVSLKELLIKENGFSFEELIEVLKLEENKKFLNDVKPILMDWLKKEFPFLSMFL